MVAVALTTICCLSVAELVALQVCDVWFDFHAGYGIPGFHGTLAIHVARRKNDCERKGHHPPVGKSNDLELELVHQSKVSTVCLSTVCLHTHGLAPLGSNVRGRPSASGRSLRRGHATLLRHLRARKGGLSTAIAAGVSVDILYLQSGHSPPKAARNYMHLQDPHRLFDTYRAFGL